MKIEVTKVVSNRTPLALVSQSAGLLTASARTAKTLADAADAAAAELGGSASANAEPDAHGRYAVRLEVSDASWCLVVRIIDAETAKATAAERAVFGLENKMQSAVVARAKQATAFLKRLAGIAEAKAKLTKTQGKEAIAHLAALEKELARLLQSERKNAASLAALAGEGHVFEAFYVLAPKDDVPSVYRRLVPASDSSVLNSGNFAAVTYLVSEEGEIEVAALPKGCRRVQAEEAQQYVSECGMVK